MAKHESNLSRRAVLIGTVSLAGISGCLGGGGTGSNTTSTDEPTESTSGSGGTGSNTTSTDEPTETTTESENPTETESSAGTPTPPLMATYEGQVIGGSAGPEMFANGKLERVSDFTFFLDGDEEFMLGKVKVLTNNVGTIEAEIKGYGDDTLVYEASGSVDVPNPSKGFVWDMRLDATSHADPMEANWQEREYNFSIS